MEEGRVPDPPGPPRLRPTIYGAAHGEHLPRKVSAVSIASSGRRRKRASEYVSEDSPSPLPERTPESFILATDPSELKAPGPSDWSISEDQSGKGAGFPQEQRSTQAQTAEREPSGERSKKISDAAGVETSPANTTVADSSAESKASSEMGYGNRCTQPKGPRNPYTVDMIMASTYSPLHCPLPPSKSSWIFTLSLTRATVYEGDDLGAVPSLDTDIFPNS
ncbi:tyrosine-protein phosphatase non-receptor type 12-like [Oncorhynchus masou masou]|uniref:tyrosine-protein phosphatase non-receptor type 12-like n=1 Tax=Oncorhynchus masou masou TaxID=90313 RepID=UPI00318323E5